MDWVGRNLYWIDGFGSQINAIGLDQSHMRSNDYVPILDEELEQPHSLALLPEKGQGTLLKGETACFVFPDTILKQNCSAVLVKLCLLLVFDRSVLSGYLP